MVLYLVSIIWNKAASSDYLNPDVSEWKVLSQSIVVNSSSFECDNTLCSPGGFYVVTDIHIINSAFYCRYKCVLFNISQVVIS